MVQVSNREKASKRGSAFVMIIEVLEFLGFNDLDAIPASELLKPLYLDGKP